jgi:hypothetical protein
MDLSIIRWDGRINFRFRIRGAKLAFDRAKSPDPSGNEI